MDEYDGLAVYAEPEDAADLPIGTDGPENWDDETEADGAEETGGPDADTDGETPLAGEGEAQKKPAQSREDDSRYAAARRQAEAEARQARAETEEARARMDAFARQCGHESFEALEAHERAQRYMNDGMPEAAARELAAMRQELEGARREREQAERERQESERWNALFDEFPETQALDDLPEEAYALMQAGTTPAEAYRTVKLRRLEGENAALKQNDTNRKKAIGSLRGRGTAAERPQPFLDGLFGQ